jgi:hypothetical protein
MNKYSLYFVILLILQIGCPYSLSNYYTKSNINDLIQQNKVSIFTFSGSYASSSQLFYSRIEGYATDESDCLFPMPRSGMIKNIKVISYKNTLNGIGVIKIRKNMADTQIIVNVTPLTNSLFQSSKTATFKENDLLSISCDGTAGSSGNVYFDITMEY